MNNVTSETSTNKPTENNKTPPNGLLNIVNVTDLNTSKWNKPVPEDELWHNRLSTWLIGGFTAGITIAMLSYFNRSLLVVSPLGPIAALLSWYIKKILRRSKYMNDLLK